MASPGFSLHVTITIAPENVPKWFEAMRPAFEVVSAEPECVYFEIYQDPENPGVISWVENWNQTVEWFMDVQLKKDYYKGYFEVTEPMFLKPREFKIWKRVGPPFVVSKPSNFGK